MRANGKIAWAWFGGLLVADVLFPWHVLGAQARFSGAFLFWVVWPAIAIMSMFVLFLRWRE